MRATSNRIGRKSKKQKLEWHSFDQVFKKVSRDTSFRLGYNEEMNRLKIAQQIRASRGAKRLTQKTVAQRAGMPQSVIARAESGEHGLSLDTLHKIAAVLGKEIKLV